MLTLIEKDIKLIGNYFWVSLIMSVIMPVFLSRQSGGHYSGMYIDDDAEFLNIFYF